MARKVDPRRLAYVEDCYLTGTKPRDIERLTAEKFAVTRRTVRNDMKRVRDRLGSAFRACDPDSVRARSEAMLCEAYAAAKAKGDATAMATIAMRLAEITGAHAAQFAFKGKVEVGGVAELIGEALAGPRS